VTSITGNSGVYSVNNVLTVSLRNSRTMFILVLLENLLI